MSFPNDGHSKLYQLEDQSFWFLNRNEIILKLIQEYKFQAPFVDIGGGNGFVSAALEKNGLSTILIEPGQGAYFAKKRGLARIIASSAHQLSPKQEIKSIGLFDVVEHIENDNDFLKQIAQWQQPHDRIIITVPAYQFLWSIDDIFAGHFRRYTKKSLSELLNKIGYAPIYSSYFFSYLIPFIFFLKSIPFRLGARKLKHAKNDADKSHKVNGTLSQVAVSIFNTISRLELFLIKQKLSIPFGSSLIIIAEKK